jgi:hypothetical protein
MYIGYRYIWSLYLVHALSWICPVATGYIKTSVVVQPLNNGTALKLSRESL